MIDVATAERIVLGSMLMDAAGFNAGRVLQAGDFYLDSHRIIFSRMMTMDAVGIHVDLCTMTQELERVKQLDAIDGPAYLSYLTEGIPRNHEPNYFVKQVRREANRRRLIAQLNAAAARAADGDEPEDVAAEIISGALGLQMESAEVRPVHISEWTMPTIEELECERNATGAVLGIATGIADFDMVTTGWRPGELTYVGAIPGRGKTAFLLQCVYAAATSGVGVGVISLEMRAPQLMRRLTVMRSQLTAKKIRDPRLMDPAEWQHAKRSVMALGDLPVWGTDVSGLRPAQIASAARMMYEKGARLIVVDFVQIVREDGKDRREAINRVSAALRDTCKQLNVPFVVASQLARRDADENRRPTMQDLRESGNLEQDAHRVVLIYRPKDREGNWTGEDQLIIAKAREGVDGHVDVTYDAQALTFTARGNVRSRPQLVQGVRTATAGGR